MSLIYRLLVNETIDLELVYLIIKNLGLHLNKTLKHIAFNTLRKDIRNFLFEHLNHKIPFLNAY